MKTQCRCVQEIMEANNGYSTLQGIYEKALTISGNNFSEETYRSNIRCMLQKKQNIFFKIKPGLWALKSYEDRLPQEIKDMMIEPVESYFDRPTEHAQMQANLLIIGKELGFEGYIYSQDKKRKFSTEQRLEELADIIKIPKFTYAEMINKIKTIDVIWFETIPNTNFKFPRLVFEVESTTDIKKSLDKFLWLTPLNIQTMFIVAPKSREKSFERIIQADEYISIRDKVKFFEYEDIDYFLGEPKRLSKFGIL